MNKNIARILGLDKTASDTTTEALDLSKMTAADFLKGIEDGTIVVNEPEAEKTANEEGVVDLTKITAADFLKGIEDGTILSPEQESEKRASGVDDLTDEQLAQMSGEGLLNLMNQLEPTEQEKQASERAELEKMAESGELAHWELVGRIIAQTVASEREKLADPDLIDPASISAADLILLVESGEYELVESEQEKQAGVVGEAASKAKDAVTGAAKGWWRAASGVERKAAGAERGNVSATIEKMLAKKKAGGYAEGRSSRAADDTIKGGTETLSRLKREHRVGTAKQVAAIAAPTAIVGGGVGAGLLLRKKKKK